VEEGSSWAHGGVVWLVSNLKFVKKKTYVLCAPVEVHGFRKHGLVWSC